MNNSLINLKKKVKEAIIYDVKKGLEMLIDNLNINSSLYNNFVLISSRYNRLRRDFTNGIIQYEMYDLEINNSISQILLLIDKIGFQDLKRNQDFIKDITNEEITQIKLFRLSFLSSIIYLNSITNEESFTKQNVELKKVLYRYIKDLGLGISPNLIDNLSKGEKYYSRVLNIMSMKIQNKYSEYENFFKMGSNIFAALKDSNGFVFNQIISSLPNLPDKYLIMSNISKFEQLKLAFELDSYLENRIRNLENVKEN